VADRRVRVILKGLNRLTEKVVTKITLDVTANLIETTPVDTGWARANWVPSIGQPVIKNLPPSKPDDSQVVAGAAAEQATATAGILAYKLKAGKVFVANNVPYIIALNDGSSSKAPAGFVQQAIAKAVTSDIRGLKV
jgi:hypothetical protein